MNNVLFLKDQLGEEFPYVTKAKLEHYQVEWTDAFNALRGSKRRLGIHFPREDLERLKALEAIIQYFPSLFRNAKEGSENVFHLMTACKNVAPFVRINDWVTYLELVLCHEKRPLQLFLSMGFKNPLQFAGLVIYLLKRGMHADSIVKSGLLHYFFTTHSFEMDVIQETYKLISQWLRQNNCSLMLIEQASTLCISEPHGDFSSYSLTGNKTSKRLKHIKPLLCGENEQHVSCTEHHENLIHLYTLYGARFLFQLMERMIVRSSKTLNGYFDFILKQLNIEDIIEIYGLMLIGSKNITDCLVFLSEPSRLANFARYSKEEIFSFLSMLDEHNNTVLHLVAELCPEYMQSWFDILSEIDDSIFSLQNTEGKTIAHLVVKYCAPSVTHKMLTFYRPEHVAKKMSIKSAGGKTPLHYAARHNVEALMAILSAMETTDDRIKALVKYKNAEETVLHLLGKYFPASVGVVVNDFLPTACLPNVLGLLNRDEETVLHLLIDNHSIDVVQVILLRLEERVRFELAMNVGRISIVHYAAHVCPDVVDLINICFKGEYFDRVFEEAERLFFVTLHQENTMTLIHLANLCPEFMLDDLLQMKTVNNYTILHEAARYNPPALLSIMDILKKPERFEIRTMLLWARDSQNELFLHGLVMKEDAMAPILKGIFSGLSPHETSWALVSLLPKVAFKPKMLATVLEAYPECERFERLIEYKVLHRKMQMSFDIFQVILSCLPSPDDSTDAKEAIKIMFGDSRDMLALFIAQLPAGFCKARLVREALYKLDANLLKRRNEINLPPLILKLRVLEEEVKDGLSTPAISLSEPLPVNARASVTLKWFSSVGAIIDPRLLVLILAGFSATVIAGFSRHRFFAEAPLKVQDDEPCNPDEPFYFS